MIDYETFCKIKQARQEGLNCGQIAGELSLDIRTVKKWFDRPRFSHRKNGPQSSKLDPFKEQITRMLANHPYSNVQIFQQLKDQ